ncbi:uncharacterized protein flt3lg.L [Xenopus laevis]|uniref:Uncharacterized protein flt3lg.L n=1 Tax=Xenopus laevis TaxID=8355 RepID=A0A8J1LA85_XENLA|nr:uncharacterized protein flt3lg.L [Xenopus laevis]XP_041425556.1 uncharacterized protein flt3lg.L [Xenopus laevis]
MNFCHGAHCTIWGLCYMTLRPALVLLFLLFLNKPCLGCNFKQVNSNPITSMFDDNIENLVKYLPRDYNVSVISNLKPGNCCITVSRKRGTERLYTRAEAGIQFCAFIESVLHPHCSDLWMIYFISKELVRIEGLSGETLKAQVAVVLKEVEFIYIDCHFNVSEDCRMEKKNVIDFLNIMSSTLTSMKTDNKIIDDFSNCTVIFCDKADASVNYTTETQNTTLIQPNCVKDNKQIGEEQHSRKHISTIFILSIVPAIPFALLLFLLCQTCCKKNTEQRRTEESA